MLKNPFDRYKLCVGGSGEAGFSSGGSEPDSSYDSGSGSVSSNPGVSTSLEAQAAAQAEANAAAGYSAFWSNPANTPAGRELTATRNTQANPVNNDSGNAVNPYNPLTEPGRYSNFQNANPSATVMSQKAAMAQIEPARPGYTPMMGLGDTKTQELMRGGYTASQSLLLQMEQAKNTPTLTDDRYYANEYQKSVQNIVELSSGEHARGMQSGLPTGPNPYEYSGDLALGLLKGVQGKSGAQTTTPVNLDVLGGSRYGAQNISWDAAIRGIAPDYSELRYGTDVLARAMATREMGPYGELRSYSSAFGVLPLAVQQQIGYKAGMSAQRAGIGWDIDVSKLYEGPTESGMMALGYGGKYSPIGEVASLQPAPLAPGLGVSDIAGMQRPFTSVGKSAPVPQDFTLSPGFSPLGYVLKESVSRIGTAQGLIGEGVSYANELLFPKPNTRFENTTSIKVAGGNTTITNLGNWIDANVGRINPYNEAAVDQYNSNVEKYNSMIGQNPVVTTTETKSLSTTIPSGGEAAFLSSLIPQISPQFQTDISQWFTGGKSIDQILSEQTELWKPQKGVSGIAGMVSTSPIGGEYAALERYIIPAGLAVIGTLAIQNGQNYDLSSSPVVQRAQELWEGGGSPIQLPGGYNLPKITDVIPAPLYNAPGEGYRQIVNIPGQGLGIIAQLPGEGRNLIAKTGEVIGQGFVGFGNVIQMPKSSITPEDVISPGFDLGVAATAKITEAGRTIVTDRPIFDLSVDTGAKNTIAAKNTASDYISKTGAASALALQTTLATPFWWTQSDYTTKLAEQTGISSALDTSYPKTTGLSLQQALVVPAISTLTQPLTKIITSGSVENGMQYDTIEGIRSKPPQEKIELKKLSLPSLGGGGGGGGGFRSRKRRKVELFSFELGKDTPIPTRYGLAGQTTQYIPGTRGIAVNILNPADIAPNSLLTIGRRSQEDRL